MHGIDVCVTPTIEARCEVFLPLSSTVEQDTVVTHYGGSPIMDGAVNKAVDVGEVKADWRSCTSWACAACRQLGCSRTYDFLTEHRRNYKQDFDRAASRGGHQRRDVDYRKYESGRLRPDGHPGFNTPTGRVEL